MLSTIIICKNISELLPRAIRSIGELKSQVLISVSINNKESLGIRKNRLINIVSNEWVLLIDTDEVASSQLLEEIREVVSKGQEDVHGYLIQYQNYVFGKPVYHGGEKYAKIRLFRMPFGRVTPLPIHEEVIVSGKIGKLKGVIHHYSYVSLPQVLRKFTKYAWQMAGEKQKAHEHVTLKKLFLYGPHMVWARAIKDQGWRDGWQGVVLALCFGYMETLMYWLLIVRNLIPPTTKQS